MRLFLGLLLHSNLLKLILVRLVAFLRDDVPESRNSPCIPICMTFNAWLLKREIPDSDRIAMAIQSGRGRRHPRNSVAIWN